MIGEMTIEQLCIEFSVWCFSQGLPQHSADELLCFERITSEQRHYLLRFIERWDSTLHREIRDQHNGGLQ